jgi:hypothetical protein
VYVLCPMRATWTLPLPLWEVMDSASHPMSDTLIKTSAGLRYVLLTAWECYSTGSAFAGACFMYLEKQRGHTLGQRKRDTCVSSWITKKQAKQKYSNERIRKDEVKTWSRLAPWRKERKSRIWWWRGRTDVHYSLTGMA